jgi:glycosyltransferase involved in cell wall biosynthesis
MKIDVSCICQTHGRSWLVNEAVESFRRQRLDGLTAELILLNDCPEARFRCDVPGVRVYNVPWICDLWAKTNAALDLCKGRLFCFWDDDDISLPDRIADGVRRMGGTLAYRPRVCWTLGQNGLYDIAGEPLLVAAMLDLAHIRKLGGVPAGEWNDIGIWDKYWPTRNVIQDSPGPAEMQYVYRWDGTEWHVSGVAGKWSSDRGRLFRKKALDDKRFVGGVVDVVPAWRQDYAGMVKTAIEQGKGVGR